MRNINDIVRRSIKQSIHMRMRKNEEIFMLNDKTASCSIQERAELHLWLDLNRRIAYDVMDITAQAIRQKMDR